MSRALVVALKDKQGIQLHQPVSPNRWQGEANCIVGPFSSRTVAEYFAHPVVDFGHYEVTTKQIFVKGDSWYVEIGEFGAVYQTLSRGEA